MRTDPKNEGADASDEDPYEEGCDFGLNEQPSSLRVDPRSLARAFGESYSEKLLDVGIVEPIAGGSPRCVIGATAHEHRRAFHLIITDRRQQMAFDDGPEGHRHERLLLTATPSPDPRGTGVLAQVLQTDDTVEDVLIRRAVPADALWLSSLGREGEPSLEMLDELVQRRAEWRPKHEKLRLLTLPRMAPHGLAYRIGSSADHRTWVRIDRQWVEERTALRHQMPERAMGAFSEFERRPWSLAIVRRPSDLLSSDCPAQDVQPWAVVHALGMIDRESRDHDELLGLLLCSEEGEQVDASTLGSSLAAVVTGIGDYVAACMEAEDQSAEDEYGPGPLFAPLAELADPGFSLTVRALVSALYGFEDYFADPVPARWGH